MSYTPSWTNQDASGHVLAGDWIAAADVNELADALDRRHKLLFNPASAWPMDFAVSAGDVISHAPIGSIRTAVGQLLPPSYAYRTYACGWDQLSGLIYWLYPAAGGDENKFIVPDGKPPGGGEVGFFAKLNGGTNWTGSPVAGTAAKAVDINEPRDAAALLSRGRFVLRVGDGGAAKASTALPGGLWYPPAVARDGTDEMHSWFGGRAWLWQSDGDSAWFGTRGQSVTVRSSSKIRLRPEGGDVDLKLYHCKRNVNTSSFSWTKYDVPGDLDWATAGGTGAADAAHIADLSLTDYVWTEHTDASFVALLQQMADGDAEPTFMIAPGADTGWGDDPIHIDVEVVLDFDLDSPPA